MIIRPLDAIREALYEIQELGYVVLSARDGEHVEIIWPRGDDAPDIEDSLNILKADADILGNVLAHRTVTIPMWLILGYPWDRPLRFWKKMKVAGRGHHPLDQTRRAYAAACVEFYKDKNSRRWKNLMWEEPWPISL